MSVYTQVAMDALRAARRDNPNMSQRGLARNIFMLTDLNRADRDYLSPVNAATNNLFRLLNHPTEVAIQHLIRGIDRQFQNEVTVTRAAANRKPRNRKTVSRGHRITF